MRKIIAVISLCLSVILFSGVCVNAQTPPSTLKFKNITELKEFVSVMSGPESNFDDYYKNNVNKVICGIYFSYPGCKKAYEKISKVPFVARVDGNINDFGASFIYEYDEWEIRCNIDDVFYVFSYGFDEKTDFERAS